MYTLSKQIILENEDQLLELIVRLGNSFELRPDGIRRVLRKYPKAGGGFWGKADLRKAMEVLEDNKILDWSDNERENFLRLTQKKVTRSVSGVTPVTVLTKPFPCPGRCIFCPNDVRMPKSYLSDEPGAQRATRNKFDPYAQTYNRLLAFKNTGHSTDKIELIILGGTWTSYTREYRIWFVKRCFDALNDFRSETADQRVEAVDPMPFEEDKLSEISGDKVDITTGHTYNRVISSALSDRQESATWDDLWQVQRVNEQAECRCVGLSIETRPDEITEEAVREIRMLGATKTQIGFQSLQDEVLRKNHRGHDVATTRRAVGILRRAGFKIQAHWMPNLHGSNPELDKQDYVRLFEDGDFMPDELKVYPCSLIETAELMAYFKAGLWEPYTHEELLDVLTFCLSHTPEYCRLSRVVRDISSDDIVKGNKITNFRELAHRTCEELGLEVRDIRAREIRSDEVRLEDLEMRDVVYTTSVSEEHFVQFVTKDNRIAGFVRLSLPRGEAFLEDLQMAAVIRELHVYGPSLRVGEQQHGKAQHHGLGRTLLDEARRIASEKRFEKLAVISAVGTREYYRKQGFIDGEWYQFLNLKKT